MNFQWSTTNDVDGDMDNLHAHDAHDVDGDVDTM